MPLNKLKIQLQNNVKEFKDSFLFTFLFVILVMVRVIMVTALLSIPMLLSFLVFKLLGVKNVYGKWIDLFEKLSFYGDLP